LSANRDEVSATKKNLLSLQSDLVSQREAIVANKSAQQSLLAQTKNKESAYQQLVLQKKAQEQAFEDELLSLQNQLTIAIDSSRLPPSGRGILSWPFSSSFMSSCNARKSVFGNIYCVTQYFGNTAFSTANPQIYSGKGHNGIDIAAPIGTPLRAALSGVVSGTGNSDLIPACYSYGKWVLVKHSNGISSLYAHLSKIGVSEGDEVATGGVIGYSGMTGYSTGPHLHFTVIATQGIKIMKLGEFRGTKTPCSGAVLPVAPTDAYLNPLSYL
jgi:murein DD-endopeptidase MepM/ murein hydrolase activator NlpD